LTHARLGMRPGQLDIQPHFLIFRRHSGTSFSMWFSVARMRQKKLHLGKGSR
jgi:hypothetical protein